jgi:UDP-N-acetylglucosamine 1-carboxyvinyltransferase
MKVQGGRALSGVITISGAKNAALPILAGCLLCDERIALHNVPKLRDLEHSMDVLSGLGVTVTRQEHTVMVHANHLTTHHVDEQLGALFRASILMLGALLGRVGRAVLPFPGGCPIGARLIDWHLQGLRTLGAHIDIENGLIVASAPHGLKGATFAFDQITVTGTENLMIAAVLAKGQTTLCNVAKEPEVVDLAQFLNSMGANIQGEGTDMLIINGVDKLHGTHHTLIPDRIEAGTLLCAVAITGGAITLNQVQPQHLTSVLYKLQHAGCDITVTNHTISATMHNVPKAIDLVTGPYPGFPTDMQAQFTVLNAIAEGASTIEEVIFEHRFQHIPELIRMGADLRLKGNNRMVMCVGTHGVLQGGAHVRATDLRSAAALILAGLACKNSTYVEDVHYLDRGYEQLECKLQQLGANIERLIP